jgi:predicted ribosome quality control (RQC) complex YloA/Tae2 family protein
MMNKDENNNAENDNFIQQHHQVHSACKTALRRIGGKLFKQEKELIEAEKYIIYQQWADTLISKPNIVARGATECLVENIHTNEVESIPLNSKFNVIRNAQLYYKKSKKGKRGLEIITQKINDTLKEKNELELLITECEAIKSTNIIENDMVSRLNAIKSRLPGYGTILPTGHSAAELKYADTTGTLYRHYIFDGWNVFVGKNDSQNDELTTKFAKPQDIWMHVAGHAGSHLVIKRDKNSEWPPKEVLTKAASLAAWFSKAKHASYTEVHATEARYVCKRRKSPPGEVVVSQYKTIKTSPVSPQQYFPGEYTV